MPAPMPSAPRWPISAASSPSWSCATAKARQKFIEIEVDGRRERRAARTAIAMSIANSPLVKTAIAGEDANWGRVVMAVGKAGEPAERDKLAIRFGDTQVARGRARGRRL